MELYMEENTDENKYGTPPTRELADVTIVGTKVLSCIARMGQRSGKNLVSQVLTGSKNKKVLDNNFNELAAFGFMAKQTVDEVNAFIDCLTVEGYLCIKEAGLYQFITITQKGWDILLEQKKVFLPKQRQVGIKSIENRQVETGKAEVKQVEIKQMPGTEPPTDPLFEALRELRKKLAEEQDVPPYVVFSNATIRNICMKMPRDPEELLLVDGIGFYKKDQYGEKILETVAKFKHEE